MPLFIFPLTFVNSAITVNHNTKTLSLQILKTAFIHAVFETFDAEIFIFSKLSEVEKVREHFVLCCTIDLFLQISWLELDQIVLLWLRNAFYVPFCLIWLLGENAIILVTYPNYTPFLSG